MTINCQHTQVVQEINEKKIYSKVDVFEKKGKLNYRRNKDNLTIPTRYPDSAVHKAIN